MAGILKRCVFRMGGLGFPWSEILPESPSRLLAEVQGEPPWDYQKQVHLYAPSSFQSNSKRWGVSREDGGKHTSTGTWGGALEEGREGKSANWGNDGKEQEINFFQWGYSSSGRVNNIPGCSSRPWQRGGGRSWWWVAPCWGTAEGLGRVGAQEEQQQWGVPTVHLWAELSHSFLKLTHQRTPVATWADTTRKGLKNISRT